MTSGATTAVIPNWNGQGMLAKLLSELPRQSAPFDRVLVVDNGSTDDSVAIAERLGAEVIRLPSNQGFAPAVNQGVGACDTPFVAVLNNDVTLHQDWLALLKPEFTGVRVAGACGKILQQNNPRHIDGTFDAISRAACAWRCGADREDGSLWNAPREISLVPFTAALFRRSAWQEIGGLDPRLESYLEDVDFGIRSVSKGYTSKYQPAALAWHLGSATRGAWHPATVRQIARNQVWLVAKHYSGRALLKYGWPIAVGQGVWGMIALRHGRGFSYLRGKIEGILGASRMRAAAQFAPDEFFSRSERDIEELQKKSGFDPYWRIYFAVT